MKGLEKRRETTSTKGFGMSVFLVIYLKKCKKRMSLNAYPILQVAKIPKKYTYISKEAS